MSSPTARTLTHLRRLGYLAAVVERWLPRVERKRDLFGVGDILAVHPRDQQVLLVQATSAPHVADRLRRVQARPETAMLLRAGVGVEVWGWCRRGDRWKLKRVAVRRGDPAPLVLEAPAPRRARRGERQRGLFDAAPGAPVESDIDPSPEGSHA
jgi:hypothetical protein